MTAQSMRLLKFPAALRGKGPMDDLRERCTRMPAHVDLCRQVQ